MVESIDDYLSKLNTFISNSKNKIQSVLTQLDWTEESLFSSNKESDDNLQSDSENKFDHLPKEDENSYSEGYIVPSNRITAMAYYAPYPFILGITKEPMDSEKLYNEIMASLPQPTKVKQEVDEEKVIRKQLAAERDAKRRRISYKNKVHTKNKTHTEILREVIHQQMTALEDWVTQESGKTLESKIETEEEKESTKGQPNNSELIELGQVGGNCHTVWKQVGEILRRRLKAEEAEEANEQKRKRSDTCDGDREQKKKRKDNEEAKKKNHVRKESYKEYRSREDWEYGNRSYWDDWDYGGWDEREHRKRDDRDSRTKDLNRRNREEKEYKKREHKDHRQKKERRKDHSVERAEKPEKRHKRDRHC